MKKGMMLLLLMASVFAQGQSLKEALYSGRLKSQPGAIIRKGDDLSSMMDTTSKVPPSDSAKAAAKASEAETRKYTAPMDLTTMNRNNNSAAAAVKAENNKAALADKATADSAAAPAAGTTETAAATEEPVAQPEAPAKPKDNNAVWKDYMNTVVATLKSEALSSKKVKKDTYYASVGYSIETDGQVTVNDVTLSPENDYLQKQIKERITLEAPRLNPVLNSSGTPRKVTKRYNFSLTKE